MTRIRALAYLSVPAERVQGDVPGRVMITVMTAAPVLAILIPFLPEFIDANTATGQLVVERDRYYDG